MMKPPGGYPLFWGMLLLGYATLLAAFGLFWWVGAISGWDYSGDAAGGLLLVYGIYGFIPHLAMGLIALIGVSMGALTYRRRLGPLGMAAVGFYFAGVAVLLYALFAPNGGFKAVYWARKRQAPDYYPSLHRAFREADRLGVLPAAKLYRQNLDTHPLLRAFASVCIEKGVEAHGANWREAYRLRALLRRAGVTTLTEAERAEAREWRYDPGDEDYEKTAKAIIKRHPRWCDKEPDNALREDLLMGLNDRAALDRWRFRLAGKSVDLWPLSQTTVAVADQNRGLELWRRRGGRWVYDKTLWAMEAFRVIGVGDRIITAGRPEIGRRRRLYVGRFEKGRWIKEQAVPFAVEELKDWQAQDGYLYMACGYGGLRAADLRDGKIEKMPVIGWLRNNYARDLRIVGDHVRVATRKGLVECDKKPSQVVCRPPRPPKGVMALASCGGVWHAVARQGKRIALLKASENRWMRAGYVGNLGHIQSISAAAPQNLTTDKGRLWLPAKKEVRVYGCGWRYLKSYPVGSVWRLRFLPDGTPLAAVGERGIVQVKE